MLAHGHSSTIIPFRPFNSCRIVARFLPHSQQAAAVGFFHVKFENSPRRTYAFVSAATMLGGYPWLSWRACRNVQVDIIGIHQVVFFSIPRRRIHNPSGILLPRSQRQNARRQSPTTLCCSNPHLDTRMLAHLVAASLMKNEIQWGQL